jgi:diguanylate cyclase (GGDEF)-like protein
MSIRYKIMFILLVLALSTHFVITTIYYHYSQKAIKAEAINRLESMANVQKERVNTFINNNYEKLRLINSRTQLRRSLKQYNQTSDADALNLVKKIIADTLKSTQSIVDIFVINIDGETIASVKNKHPQHSHKDHPLFLEAMDRQSVNYLIDENDMTSTKIIFSAPLELDGELLGVIAMQVDMDNLNEYLRDYTGLGMSGEVLMAMDYKDNEMLFFTPLRFKKTPLLVKKRSETAKPMNLALQQIETTLDGALDYRNEPVIATTSYLNALGFGIVVKMDKAEVFKTSHDLKVLILTLIVGLVLLVIIVSIFLANMITKPVINIIEAATMISQGDYQKRILALSNDELGQLANALNAMAERLIRSNQILEEKVKNRTEELRRTNEQLEKISQTDALTGIGNRGKFNMQLEESFRRCRRYKKSISLLIADLDQFKAVNDYYGHQTGDAYLKEVANVLKNVAKRVDDFPARYGGEEFALILEDTDIEGAMSMAEKIRQRIIDLKLENLYSKVEQYLTISIGVATVNPDMDIDTTGLIQRADKALYQAKKNGRNRIEADSKNLTR